MYSNRHVSVMVITDELCEPQCEAMYQRTRAPCEDSVFTDLYWIAKVSSCVLI